VLASRVVSSQDVDRGLRGDAGLAGGGRGTTHSLTRPLIPTRTAIEKRIARFEGRLSPNRRRLLQATLENPDETFFLSSRALARRYRVDPATIVRTVQALGYQRYTDFATDLREHFVSRLTPYRILKATTDEKRSLADHVRHSLERDLGNLNRLRSGLDPERVVTFARRIHQARRILVVGSDLAASLASFLAYALLPLGFDAEAPVGTGGNLQHKGRLLTSKDLLVAISFGRCLRVTVEAAKLARSREVPTVAITDSDTTPLARECDDYFVASTAGATFSGSYVAPMALLNAIVLACAEIAPSRALALLRQTEKEYLSGPRWYEEAPGRDEDRSNQGRSARRRK
jgi:RpiR family transcriptional regulator, carbohydrate utilization regulator